MNYCCKCIATLIAGAGHLESHAAHLRGDPCLRVLVADHASQVYLEALDVKPTARAEVALQDLRLDALLHKGLRDIHTMIDLRVANGRPILSTKNKPIPN